MDANDPVRRYDIPDIERLLGPGVEWREAVLDEMYPAGDNAASTSSRYLQGLGATEQARF